MDFGIEFLNNYAVFLHIFSIFMWIDKKLLEGLIRFLDPCSNYFFEEFLGQFEI